MKKKKTKKKVPKKAKTMNKAKNWLGYQSNFIEGHEVPMPKFPADLIPDLAVNSETGKHVFDFIYYSSVHSLSRKMPYYSASNIFRDHWVKSERAGTFKADERLLNTYQYSDDIYSQVNKKHAENNRKVDKGHLVRREDVQWDENKNEDNAIEAAKSTFFYTNACPQHHQLNNEIWKYLESSILIKGHSKKPEKAIVFTGPIFNDNDPNLVFPEGVNYELKCPIRFWKVIYYVNEQNELRCAAFIMSHKLLMERDGHIVYKPKVRSLKAITEKTDIPFLMFEENEKYQITLSLLSELTNLTFPKAKEGLTEEQRYSKLTSKPTKTVRSLKMVTESFTHPELPIEIEGLFL